MCTPTLTSSTRASRKAAWMTQCSISTKWQTEESTGQSLISVSSIACS
uniref:Uncharacterized protein n=1 Tax=Arundo donax TaxID=35708 RepID=A0A0A8ZEA3_ARUDO